MKPEECYEDQGGITVRVIGRGETLFAIRRKPSTSFHVMLCGSGQRVEMAIRCDFLSAQRTRNAVVENLKDVGAPFSVVVERRPIFRQYV